MNYASPPRGLFEGVNFMTPHIEGYFKVSGGYAELSSGRGLSNEPIFGVTLSDNAKGKSQLFGSRREALKYIESIQV